MSERDYGFARLPAEWIRAGRLQEFRGGNESARSATALKLYITILACTRSDDMLPGPGRARLSFDALEEKASVARAMIPGALEMLRPWIEVERSARGNVYSIIDWTDAPGRWVKLPAAYIQRNGCLGNLSSRVRGTLSALKIYLYLLERRQRQSNDAVASYAKIRSITGVQQNEIAGSLSALGSANLIRWYSSRRTFNPANPGHNVYEIIGLRAPSFTTALTA